MTMFTKDNGRKIYPGVAITYTSGAGSTTLTPGTYLLRNSGNDAVHFNTEETADANDCMIVSSSSLDAVFPYPVAVSGSLYFYSSTGGTIYATLIE
jgi:hypothetical protein